MKQILTIENIILNADVKTKEDAITLAGNLLVENGYVKDDYVTMMFEREKLVTTYVGNNVAIPHGTGKSEDIILNSGISIVQIPNGVDYGDGNIANVVFGIAGKNNEHLEILSQIAILCSEEDNVKKIVQSNSKEELIKMFSEVN